MDLATEWRGRRWRRLLNFIDGLPRSSEYYQAISDDERFAELVLDQESAGAAPARRMVEWTPELEMLTNIFDRLGEQITVAMAAAGAKKPVRPKPAPRPKTAFDRVRLRRRELESQRLASRLIPSSRKTDKEG